MVAQTHTPGGHQGATHYRRSKGHPVPPTTTETKQKCPPVKEANTATAYAVIFFQSKTPGRQLGTRYSCLAPTGGQGSAHSLPPGDGSHLQRDS